MIIKPQIANHNNPTAIQLDETPALGLISLLCETLNRNNVNYCHWKSNAAIDLTAQGINDLDLLISRADAQKFTEILFRLGFREAQSGFHQKLPGVIDYYGFDKESARLIHVHAHYQLVLGNDLSKNYCIPVADSYLALATQVGLFRIPQPEFELIIFVIRMVLKHASWDSLLMGHGALSPSELGELKYLATPENIEKAQNLLKEYLPYIEPELFEACVRAIQPGCSLARRIRTSEQLQNALEACARLPQSADIFSKFSRRIWMSIKGRVLKQESKRRMARGGLLVAIVGGDGSGKSTAIDGVYDWLARKFETRKFHMGKPAWSFLTTATRGMLKIGQWAGLYTFRGDNYSDQATFPGYPWLIRAVCTARDRYLTYLKARRLALNGSLVICDRFPLSTLAMDAPQCERIAQRFNRSNWFLAWLIRQEKGFYQKIALPDVLIVLKVDPEVAVQRKTDESEISVRARSTLVWELDWSKTPAHIIDASMPKNEVLNEVKSIIWEHL